MALYDNSRQSPIPSFLYSSSSSTKPLFLEKMLGPGSRSFSSVHREPAPSSLADQRSFLIPAPSEPGRKIEMYSPAFYAACTAGGILSCGLTHMAVTPLDLVKCNMQVTQISQMNFDFLCSFLDDLDLPEDLIDRVVVFVRLKL